MDELIKVDYADNTVMARDVYDFIFKDIESKTSFRMWIARAIKKYEFVDGKDFRSFLSETSNGRPRVDYVVTVDMGKELAMVSATKQGSIVRKYFLQCEKIAKDKAITRAIGIKTRKTLTDSIKESGENERMHGKGYSNFTRFTYKTTGLTDRYKEYKKEFPKGKEFRKTLNGEELQRVDKLESLIKSLLNVEMEYQLIKDTIEPLFKLKELK